VEALTISAMAFTVADRAIRPLTADEVMRMVRVGILGEDHRVELLHGVLTAVSPQDPPHAVIVQRLTAWLAPLMVAGTHDVRVQLPLVVPDPTSLPEPDVAVVEHDPATIAHPTTAALVIEVADSSLRVDTTIKPPLFAAAGVPELWVVDVRGRRLRTFTDARPDGYASERTVAGDATITPGRVDAPPLALDALFAGL
jgi:Uma2 family endonuclease